MTGRSVSDAFRGRFGIEPSVARAPGRVNLIGEHTDYNGGLVLPAAVDLYLELAFAPNDEGVLRGYSLALDREDAVRLSALAAVKQPSWIDYAAGVAWALLTEGTELQGMDFVLAGTLPMGAGLSSSAAFELAVARALSALAGVSWDARRAAELAQRAENQYVGMPCGIMDQMAIALSQPGCALLLNCGTLAYEHVAIPRSWCIVVMDTGTRRALATAGYEERTRECERAAEVLRVGALVNASPEALERTRSRLSENAYRKARHVLEENARVVEMAEALRAGDAGRTGELMAESHASLRDLFEVSTPELDGMVELAARRPECLGARMTGAGFGGSAVALVEASGTGSFVTGVEEAYRERTGRAGKLHVARAAGGVSLQEPR